MNEMSGDVYLQARPADYDLDPKLQPQGEKPTPPSRNMKDGHSQLFDSGVADLEMHRISISKSSLPRSSAMYEYIDPVSHYEVPDTLPRSVSQYPNGGRQSVISDCRSVVTDVTSDTDDTATIFKTPVDKKKRYNPLYQPSTEVVSLAEKDRLDSMQTHLKVQCAFLVLISILALAALALGLYLVFFQINNNDVTVRIRNLEDSNRKLITENEEMRIIITAAGFNVSLSSSPFIKSLIDASTTVLTFEEHLTSLDDRLAFSQQNLSQSINALASTVDAQLLNISKMPGPQGPPGAGNFSACTYKNFTSTIGPTSTPTGTSLQPSIAELETKVVMFAACGLKGGTSFSLETNVITPNKVQYKCVCSGKVDNQDRVCKIHLWLCPRESREPNG